MNRWILLPILSAPLLMPGELAATKPPSAFVPDPDLLQKFATNSLDVLALETLPADQKVNYALALGGFWLQRQDASKAGAYFDFARETAKRNGMKKEEGEGWFGSALLADATEDLPAALERAAKAVGLFNEAGEKEMARQAMFFRASLQHRRGMYADSLRTYSDIRKLADGPDGELIKAECLAEIALLNYKMGRTNAVAADAQQALKVFEARHYTKGAADCLKILGNQAGGDGRPSDAIDFYERAAARYKEAGDVHGQANCLYNMGITLQGTREYDKAIARLQDAVGAYTRSASVTGVGIANAELGRTYFLSGDLPKAEATLDLARSLLSKSQDLCRLAETEGYLADLKVSQGIRQQAIAHHQTAIRLYEQAKLGDRVRREEQRLQKAQSLSESPVPK
jgi:tetratricopeptide (TPR) repeat protein